MPAGIKDPSRQADSHDASTVVRHLHPGVKLLLNTSKRESHTVSRSQLERLLLEQARAFIACNMTEVSRLQVKIDPILRDEEKIRNPHIEKLEIDLYVHGWSSDGEISPIIPSTTTNSVMPERRMPVSTYKPQKITPFANGDSTVLNIGEVAASGGNLVKKVSQLEHVATYARVRASGEQDILEVVGYAALGMSLIDGSEVAAAIITLHE